MQEINRLHFAPPPELLPEIVQALRTELIHTAAVCVSMLEHMDTAKAPSGSGEPDDYSYQHPSGGLIL